MIISLDFELYWGVRHLPTVKAYRRNLIGARTAIPKILKLLSDYNIHATWATVGFLFCEGRDQLLGVAPIRRPNYREGMLLAYEDLPAQGEHDSPDSIFFAPSLIRRIANTANQEVATHTFSHYYCLEEGADIESFRADLLSASRAAQSLNLKVTSLVFPKNQERHDFLGACVDAGITAYRGNPSSALYLATPDRAQTLIRRFGRLVDAYVPLSGNNCTEWPCCNDRPPVRIPASRYLRPYSRSLRFLEPIRLARIKRDLTAAAKRGLRYHLWFHPHNFGRYLEENCRVLREIFDHYQMLQRIYGMESLNMAEVAHRCLSNRPSEVMAEWSGRSHTFTGHPHF